jgi:regulator of cell morphogenesis and NO signaling
MPTIDPSQTIARIVLDHPAAARVFQSYRIDFCCHGDVPLPEACARAGVDPQSVSDALDRALSNPSAESNRDLRSVSTPALIGYIIDRHHGYLRDALPGLRAMTAKIALVHGEHNPKLKDLDEAVTTLADSLEPHLLREEQVLFPSLMARDLDAELVRDELERMATDHKEVGDLLFRIRALAEDFRVPEWGCGTYRACFRELEAMEGDILRHVHLENHLLMPRFMGAA